MRSRPLGRSLARSWWPLTALTLAAAALRLSTLGMQSLWYDEAYTPVHVLHASVWATLQAMARHENTPPLWYVSVWVLTRAFGDGAVALRSLSALAGVATVPVVWHIGARLAGRRAAVAAALLVAGNPLLVWYSQEARAYALFAFMSALAILCCLRADERPTLGRMTAFALSAGAALLTHYFAAFLMIGMVLWLARSPGRLRQGPVWGAFAALAVLALALVPLAIAQGGHGTQWIGRWTLSSRLQAIPQYYLTGYSGAPLGRGIELLVAVPIVAGIILGLARALTRRESDAALWMVWLCACGALLPLALALAGADYLAPRNLIAMTIPLTLFVAVVCAAARSGAAGMALIALAAVGFATVSVDVDLSPRLQRGDWSGVAAALGRPAAAGARAIVTVQLGAAPLEYYLRARSGGLRNMPADTASRLSEIDEVGYAPLRASAGGSPAPGFRLLARRDINGLVLYRFTSHSPRALAEAQLRAQRITSARAEVLVGGGAPTRSLAARAVPSKSSIHEKT